MASFTLFTAIHTPPRRMLYNFSSPRNTLITSLYSLPNPAALYPSTSIKRRSQLNYRRFGVLSALKKLSDSELVAISSESDGIFPSDSGVYAVYNGNGDIQFIGITRNLTASILTHLKSVPELCSSVKVAVVEEPADKTALTEAWKSWMQEHIAATGKVPPGNEPGNTTWIKNAPTKKADLRLTPGRHVGLTVPLEGLVNRLVKENKVVAFIKGSRNTPLCGFSRRVLEILESQGVEYESVDVLDEEYNCGLRETLKKYSNWPTFPQIFVNGELVGGCDILTSMYEKGELAGLF
ncbi:Bifunctional monothiol glutaredoxin-S16, chloroplastic [Orobanche gracilis]